MAERSEHLTWQQGGCHCGAVRFAVLCPGAPEVIDCNCSICAKTGYLHLIVPPARFRLLSGEAALRTYRFNTGIAKHLFCATCGIKSFYVPRSHPEGFSVNYRCLDKADPGRVRIVAFDGRNWDQSALSLAPLSA